MKMKLTLILFGFICCVSGFVLDRSERDSVLSYIENDVVGAKSPSLSHPLMVDLTLIEAAAATRAGLSLSLTYF